MLRIASVSSTTRFVVSARLATRTSGVPAHRVVAAAGGGGFDLISQAARARASVGIGGSNCNDNSNTWVVCSPSGSDFIVTPASSSITITIYMELAPGIPPGTPYGYIDDVSMQQLLTVGSLPATTYVAASSVATSGPTISWTSGDAPFTVTWTVQTTMIATDVVPSASSDTVMYAWSASQDSKTLQVSVVDTATSSGSSSTTLYVISATVADVVVVAGNTATFSSSVTSQVDTYQWLKGVSNAPGSSISSSYTLPAATVPTDDGTQYSVIVSSSASPSVVYQSSPATLRVLSILQFTDNYAGDVYLAGTQGSFGVTGSGFNTIRLQSSTNGGTTWSNVGPPSTQSSPATITTPSLMPTDNQIQFRVVVSYNSGPITVTSSAFTLTVLSGAGFMADHTPPVYVTGSNAQLTVTGTGFDTVQWQKVVGGSWSNFGAPVTLMTGATSATLTISSLSSSDDQSQYQAILWSSLNPATTVTTSSITLTVLSISQFTDNHANDVYLAGTQGSFSVTGSGFNNVQLQSSTNGGTTWSNVGPPSTQSSPATITTPSLMPTDNQIQFRVVVSYNSGPITVTSSAFTLTVLSGAGFMADHTPPVYVTGSNAQLTVTGTGFDTVQWQKVVGGSWSNFGAPVTLMTGATSATLTISSLSSSDDQSQYQAILWSSLNPATTITTSSITLIVLSISQFTANPSVATFVDGSQGSFTVTGTGFNNVQLQSSTDGGTTWSNVGIPVVGLSSVTVTSGPLTAANNQNQFRVVVSYNSGAVTTTSSSITITVFGISQQPQNQVIVAGSETATFSIMVDGAAPDSITWQAMALGSGFFTNVGAGLSVSVTSPPGAHRNIYRAVVIKNSIQTTSQTASLQVIVVSYSPSSPAVYDYYGGVPGQPWIAGNLEPAFPFSFTVTNLLPLDNAANQMANNLATVALYTATGVLLNFQSAVNIDTLSGVYNVPSTPALPLASSSYAQAIVLNGASVHVTDQGVTHTPAPAYVLNYPPKVSPTLPGRWSASPAGFGDTSYTSFPEPGHWDYSVPQSVTLNFVSDGFPSVIGATGDVVFSIVPQTGLTPVILSTNTLFAASGAGVASTYTIPGTITTQQARTVYLHNRLSVAVSFPTAGLSGFQMLWQPLDLTKDRAILSPHFPPTLATTQPQGSFTANLPDTAVYSWYTRPIVVFDGFPKHDSIFANPAYAPSGSLLLPLRNYDQILEFRSTVAGTPVTYASSYAKFAGTSNTPPVAPSTDPLGAMIQGASMPTGVFVATSTISPTTTTPMYLYNKWEYRWVIGVYRVSGQYEPYVPGSGGLSPPAGFYTYHAISGGFLGIWNWYPREFSPALCPSISGPFDVGTTNAIVVGPTTASMYPGPDEGVLSWAYSHHAFGPSYRVDTSLASYTLDGAASAQTLLLPLSAGGSHTFSSSYTSTTVLASPTAFGPGTEILGYTVTASGRVSQVLMSDANSIFAPQYTFTLPDSSGGTTVGERTVTGPPTVMLVNNCRSLAQLSAGAAAIVSHRPGETLLLSFGSQTGSVSVLASDPTSLQPPTTVLSLTLTGTPSAYRFTTGYSATGQLLTSTKLQLSSATISATVYVYEYSSLPANWPFQTPNVPLNPLPVAGVNVALSSCITGVSATNNVINAPPASSQYIGCGTATPQTPPANC